MSKQCALSVKNLSISYNNVLVLDSVSLSVPKGQIFGLIGLNGQGKTTLIKSVLDLARPEEGEIGVFDKPHDNPSVRKAVSYLPERFDPAWFLKGWEFLEFVFKLHDTKLVKEDVAKHLDALGLPQEAMNRAVRTYSKGMRQKLGIIGAACVNADLIILDEPMSGLDPASRVAVKNLIKNLKKQKKTVFFSSHILSDMEELCDQVSVLHHKKVQYTGKPSSLMKKTKDKTLEAATLRLIEAQKAA